MTPPLEHLSWIGLTKDQHDLLESLHFISNNGWDRNGQTASSPHTRSGSGPFARAH